MAESPRNREAGGAVVGVSGLGRPFAKTTMCKTDQFGDLPKDELCTIVERCIRDLLVVLLICLQPAISSRDQREWIRKAVKRVACDLQTAARQIAG